jgi:N-dimethylarginine dimethylaminohydrolase
MDTNSDNTGREQRDETPQVLRDIFDEVAEQQGTEPHSKFVMCRPQFLSTAIPNNVFMEGKNKEEVDVPRALNQWDRSAHILEAFGVEVLEIPPKKGCQDQCYVANIGIAIEPCIVLAKYKAPGRACEVPPARKFFMQHGYKCIQPPFFFEGEADLKLWKPGFYFGGWGLFSTKDAFKWIEEKTGCTIIPVHEIDPKTYHLDCSLLVVDEENFIVNTNGLDKESVKALEKCGNVIATPDGIETTGITNGVLIPEKHIYLSGTFQPENPDYRKAMEWLLETMDGLHYTTVFVDTDAYGPSGADLSCSVFHLTF